MSEENDTKKHNIVIVTIKMPDGKEHEVPLPYKIFKSGRKSYYSQIHSLVFEGEFFGGKYRFGKKPRKPKLIIDF